MSQTDKVRLAVERLHVCSATHTGCALVDEVFLGQTVWTGQVEIFDITGHPRAKRCYAWAHGTDAGSTRYQAVLELPPVDSPETAVRAVIVSEYRNAKGH